MSRPFYFEVECYGKKGVGFKSSFSVRSSENRVALEIFGRDPTTSFPGEASNPPQPYTYVFNFGRTEISRSQDIEDGWSAALDFLEKKFLVNSKDLLELDKDPFSLFGLDDPEVVQVCEDLESFPALQSFSTSSSNPSVKDWEKYLNANVSTSLEAQWVAEAFSEAKLPHGWTMKKGPGNLFEFQNTCKPSKPPQSWRHPLYDSFKSLYEAVASGSLSLPKQLRLRTSRLLLSGELGTVVISPENVERLAKIFMNEHVAEKPNAVRALREYLKIFTKQIREFGQVSEKTVEECLDAVTGKERIGNSSLDYPEGDLKRFTTGSVVCVDCHEIATRFCADCRDHFCRSCENRMHSKGKRSSHSVLRLEICSSCDRKPGKVRRAGSAFCHQCYVDKVLKEIPIEERVQPPERIDYCKQLRNLEISARQKIFHKPEKEWHAFFDADGKVFYYNFKTQERMRREPTGRTQTHTQSQAEVSASAAEALELLNMRKHFKQIP